MKRSFSRLRWVILAISILFYLYEFVIRVMPSVMSDQLMESFSLNATGFGILAASYMYAYAPMQLPIGVLMDKYGAHRLLTLGAALCGIGAIFFGMADSLYIAEIGRFLAGGGSAFAFIGFIYICNHWFHGKSVSKIMGIGNSIGLLGAILGQAPTSYVINAVGWRMTSILLGGFGVLLAALIFFVVRNEPGNHEEEVPVTFTDLWRNCKQIATNKHMWFAAVICGCLYFPTGTFGGLWCAPYLEDTYGISNTIAGYGASMIFFGWLVGGPIIGHVADTLKKKRPLYIFSASIIFFAFLYDHLFSTKKYVDCLCYFVSPRIFFCRITYYFSFNC